MGVDKTTDAIVWTPIGGSKKKYNGTFDGQGHTISGLYVKATSTYTGLFAAVQKGATVKNLKLINSYQPVEGLRGKLGIPMGLNMYELYPFWYRFFTELKFEVFHSPYSNRKLYQRGQQTIPSDTVCIPAKLMHGHIQSLIDDGAEAIFYPCLSYNFDENLGDNHYNCPVVAYYAELLKGNMENLAQTKFLYPYLSVNNERELSKTLYRYLNTVDKTIKFREVRKAVKAGFAAYEAHMAAVRTEGEKAIEYAREHGKRIMILAGRPYHVDPEINHGIPELIGIAVTVILHLWKKQMILSMAGGTLTYMALVQFVFV